MVRQVNANEFDPPRDGLGKFLFSRKGGNEPAAGYVAASLLFVLGIAVLASKSKGDGGYFIAIVCFLMIPLCIF